MYKYMYICKYLRSNDAELTCKVQSDRRQRHAIHLRELLPLVNFRRIRILILHRHAAGVRCASKECLHRPCRNRTKSQPQEAKITTKTTVVKR